MHAIVVHEGGGPEVLELEELPDPEPGEGQVLVRVEAAAVNHFDLNQRRDPAATGASPPFTPGRDAAGTRADTGERVLVTGAPGTYAELLAAPLENVWPIPDSLDTARAAALGVAYKTAWASLTDGELQRGDTLLVQAGSSGTGQAAVDIGRQLGATVYATASESKQDRLRELGAEPLSYDDERIGQLQGAVDSPIVSINLWPLIGKRARIIGSGSVAASREDFEQLIDLAGKGELSPV